MTRQRRQKGFPRRGFTLIELVVAMILIGIALLPLVAVSPLMTIEQARNDQLERSITTAEAAMDQVTSVYTHPDKFDTHPMIWTPQGSGAWTTFCDPATDPTCRPVTCNPVTDPDCVPPKLIWKAWLSPLNNDTTSKIKQVRVDVCLDLDDDDGCDEPGEFRTRAAKLISIRCPDSNFPTSANTCNTTP